MTGPTLKNKVDDLVSELKKSEERAGDNADELTSRVEVFREQVAKQSSALLGRIGKIGETVEDMGDDIRESISELGTKIAEWQEDVRKEKEDKKAFAKSRRFYEEGLSAFRGKDFPKALQCFIVARNTARGVTSPVFKENGLTAAFNANFLGAQCLEKLDKSIDASDIYYQLYVETGEDSDYHKLFVEKTLEPTLRTCDRNLWDSWSEERKNKIQQATHLSLKLESDRIPYCFSPDWRVVYILSLLDPAFKHYNGLFDRARQMYNEQETLLKENKERIADAEHKMRTLSRQKEDLETAKKTEENAQPSFRPKNFSGKGMGLLVGILIGWLGTGMIGAIAPGPALLLPLITCIPAGIVVASMSRDSKFKRALDEFKKRKQQKVSEIAGLISQVEPEIDGWRKHKSQLEKWHEDNRILTMGV